MAEAGRSQQKDKRQVSVDLIDWHYRGGGSTIPFLPLIIERVITGETFREKRCSAQHRQFIRPTARGVFRTTPESPEFLGTKI